MLLSWYFLGVRYKIVHFTGLIVSLIGVVCMVVADVLLDDSKEQGLFFCNVVLICFFIIK